MRRFSSFCNKVSDMAGRPISFVLAMTLVLVWCISGPIFHFCDTWQLVINTLSSICTFMMVFLIQNSQNRESKAMQLKLDELIRCIDGAHNALLNVENLTSEEIANVQQHYVNIGSMARRDLKQGKSDTGVPEAPIHKAANLCLLRPIESLHGIGETPDVAITDQLESAPSAGNVIDIQASLAARHVIEEYERRQRA